MIDNFYVDGHGILHTFIEEVRYTTVNDVANYEEAKKIVSEMNKGIIKDTYSNWFGKDEKSEDGDLIEEDTEYLEWYENWKKENFNNEKK
tara:strand:- start:338 stop:607 length:270 start_codon:yes stop_codon:yes gene_type:complete